MPNRAPAAGGDYRWVVCCKKKGKKKRRKKKKEVPRTGIEIPNVDWIVCMFHPLRYSGMN